MPDYQIKISRKTLQDIQKSIDWYNEQLPGLGERFQKSLLSQIFKLKNAPVLYRVRYGDVRCLVIKKFPFMVHFTVDEAKQQISVFAVFHTSLDPNIWTKKRR